jgi:hypothetical protein
MLKAVTPKEIGRVLELVDRLLISREAVTIPLRPATPGSIRRLSDRRIEIVVEAERPLDDWLPELERMLRAELASGGPTPVGPLGEG